MSIYRVKVALTGGGISGPAVSHFFYAVTGGTPSQAVAATQTFWNAMKGYLSSTLSATSESDVDQLDEADGSLQGFNAVTPFTVTGTSSDDYVPPSVQLRGDLSTGAVVGKRQLRGFLYIPGCTEVQNVLGKPGPTLTGLLNTSMAALIADANSTWVVWSRKHGVAHPIISATAWSKWGSQRSRRD